MKLILLLVFFAVTITLSAQLERTHSIYFSSASSNVSASEQEQLKVFINSLYSDEVQTVYINGFGDDTGSDKTNDRLSLERAKTIENLVVQSKISSNKISSVIGEGSIPLTSSNELEIIEERKRNRRVDLKITIESSEPEIMEEVVREVQPLISENSKVGEKITLHNILFEPGSHNMYPQSEESLKRLLFYLKKYKNIHITILGHICCQTDGQDGVNKETGLKNLSEARAQAVYYYLVHKGIDKERLDFKGMRGNFPLGKTDQQDRRVEIQIKKN